MKLVEMKCKNCGSVLKINSTEKEVICNYCQTTFKIDDEVQHHKLDNAEQIGYELEKGKIRAQEEAKQKKLEEQKAIRQSQLLKEKKKKNLIWWIIGWIYCFPIPLTILIWRNNKWTKKMKTTTTVIIWTIILFLGLIINISEKESLKNKIIECYSEETYTKLDEIFGIDNINSNISSSTTCESLKLKDSNYTEIEIKLGENKELIYIKVNNEIKYGNDLSKNNV